VVAVSLKKDTATAPTDAGFLTIFPSGMARPLASNLNFGPQDTVPNLVPVAVGVGGKVSVFNAAGTTHAILDVLGWISTRGDAVGANGQYTPLAPGRVLDTRDGTGGISSALGPGQSGDLAVLGRGGLPDSGVSAVALNVTAVNPSAASFLTVSPAGIPRPLASNLNYVAGQTVANRVIVPVGAQGKVSVFNAAGSVDVVADVGGWFSDATAALAGQGLYTGVAPARILDTRSSPGAIPSTVGSHQAIQVLVVGQGGVPAAGVSAVALNVTAVNPTAAGYLAVYPSGTLPPISSELNFVAGRTVPNLVVAKVGADGRITIFNSSGNTDIILDVVGWFT